MGSFFYKESSQYFWETIATVSYSYKINFPATTKENDTTGQLYCTLSTYVTPKTISRQNQKKKKIWNEQENSYKINFPATTKKWHNSTTVLYTKYVRNTKNYAEVIVLSWKGARIT